MLNLYVRNPRDYLPADEGSAGLRSHERLNDNETVKTGRNSCGGFEGPVGGRSGGDRVGLCEGLVGKGWGSGE